MQNMSPVYNRAFYAAQIEGSVRSASAVVPRILELFPWITSVVDVGCGAGTWLHQFRLHGVSRIVGLDIGDPSDDLLHIRKSEFLCKDLSVPFRLEGGFDLAMSLEVAEHLPPESAETFISNITQLSDVIIFGAAIPGQGGTDHVNERWPSYWAALFKKRGFVCFDVLRGSLWYDERVEWWYKQNMLIFVGKNRTDLTAALQAKCGGYKAPLDLVHPHCFEIYRAASVNAGPNQPGDAFPGETNIEHMALQLLELRAKLMTIEQSTSWRAISILRRMVSPHPRLRRFIRAIAKLVLWTFNFKLLDRIQERTRIRSSRH